MCSAVHAVNVSELVVVSSVKALNLYLIGQYESTFIENYSTAMRSFFYYESGTRLKAGNGMKSGLIFREGLFTFTSYGEPEVPGFHMRMPPRKCDAPVMGG